MQNPFIDFASQVGSNIGGGLANYAHEVERRRLQQQKDAQDRLAIIQKLGGVAVENKDGAAAAGYANQMPAMLKQGYGIDVPNQKLLGEPVMARGQDRPFIEQQGPSQIPGQKVGVLGAMSPTPYQYDTGKRDLNNPRTLDQARKGLMLAAPTVEYGQLNPYEITYDKKTGKVIRQADEKPVTPHFVPSYGPGGTVTYVPLGNGTKVQAKPEKDPAPHYVEDHLPDGTVRHVAASPGLVTRPKPPANTAEDKEIAKRREAATIVGRAITKGFGGVAKVLPGSADIELDGMYPMPDKQRRMLENAAIDMGGFLYEEPGKKPRIILNPGSTASGVSSKLRDPNLVWARNIDGSQTLVEKKAGVTSAAPQSLTTDVNGVRVVDKAGVKVKDPAAAKAEADKKAAEARERAAYNDAVKSVKASQGFSSMTPERFKREVYLLTEELLEKRTAAGAGPQKSALDRLIEIEEAKQAAKKKGGNK